MSTRPPRHLNDDRFARAYAALVDDLAGVLDVTTGAAEATHSATYETLTADLTTELHLDAGLTAIIGGTPPLAPPGGDSPSTTSSTPSGRRVADHLTSLTDPERLRLRVRPSYSGLRRALTIVYFLAHHLDYMRNFDPNLERDLDLDRARARHSDRDLAIADALDLDLDHVLDPKLASDFARGEELDFLQGLPRVLDLARDLARDLALDLALECLGTFRFDLGQADDMRNTAEVLKDMLTLVAKVGDDFVGADLRAAGQLIPLDLTGIRWSSTTTWPPEWADRIRAASAEIEPGIFQVVGEQWKRSLAEAEW